MSEISARFFRTNDANWGAQHMSQQVEPYRRAVGYVDGISKDDRSINLPVQTPAKCKALNGRPP